MEFRAVLASSRWLCNLTVQLLCYWEAGSHLDSYSLCGDCSVSLEVPRSSVTSTWQFLREVAGWVSSGQGRWAGSGWKQVLHPYEVALSFFCSLYDSHCFLCSFGIPNLWSKPSPKVAGVKCLWALPSNPLLPPFGGDAPLDWAPFWAVATVCPSRVWTCRVAARHGTPLTGPQPRHLGYPLGLPSPIWAALVMKADSSAWRQVFRRALWHCKPAQPPPSTFGLWLETQLGDVTQAHPNSPWPTVASLLVLLVPQKPEW